MQEHIEMQAHRGVIPNAILDQLLRHASDEIAVAAAIGMWDAQPKGSINPALRAAWRDAILRANGKEYELREIFSLEPGLALDWLRRFLARDHMLSIHPREAACAAASSLSSENRLEILGALPAYLPDDFVRSLVGGDCATYRAFLALPTSKDCWQAPLHGIPSAPWLAMAKEALAVGKSPNQIADAAFGSGWSWHGKESDRWRPWKAAFAALGSDPSAEIQAIGRIGAEHAGYYLGRAVKREEEEAIYGDW